jgi:hypothetical protein
VTRAKIARGGGFLLAAILGTVLADGPARAEPSTQGSQGAPASPLLSPQEISFRFAYGSGERDAIDFYTFGPRVAYDFPDFVPAILGNRLRLAIEATGSIIYGRGHDGDGEFAFSPLIFNYRYDTGGFFVPYVEGGEGIVLTTLSNMHIGGPFEFSSQAGGGFHLFFDHLSHENALSFDIRLRHISNLGISNENRGLNTVFFTIGLSHFPGRK